MRIQLVQAPSDYGKTRSSGCYPPLGLLSIATYLFQQLGLKPEILDGEITGFEEIASKLNAEFVGFTVNLLNTQNSVKLSEIAKTKGAKVVWGGPHSTIRWKQIIRNQKSVDYVVRGDGEQALIDIIQDRPQNSSNVAYRGRKGVVSRQELPLYSYPFPDYNLLPKIEKYIDNSGGLRILSVCSHRGCAFRTQHAACIFCSITDRKLRLCNPKDFVANILHLQQKYRVSHLRDCGDSITGSKPWLRELAGLLKAIASPKFYIYARADEIDEEATELLAAIKTELVYLGGESGDDQILQSARKKETREQILKAIQLLGSQGIKVRISFIAGLPGESSGSLDNTKGFIGELIQLSNVIYVPFSIILPLPGSKVFRMMEQKFPRLKNEDVLDLKQLQELWVNNFCGISFNELQQKYHEIKSLNALKFNRGMGEKS